MNPVRCAKCNKLLGKLTAPYEVKCPRCGYMESKEESQG
jgi:phage FluMu protein Com